MADSNPTYQYVTGAVHVYARVPYAATSPYNPTGLLGGYEEVMYVGTCEKAPEEDKAQVWAPYHNSIGGDTVPMDKTFQGSVATIKLDLNRYNNEALRTLKDSPLFGRGGQRDGGYHVTGDIGKMLIANGVSFQLWLVHHMWQFRAVARNIVAFPDLEPGTFYPACSTVRVFEGRKGVTPNMVYLEIEAQRAYDAYERAFMTYSHNPTYFTNLPLPL